MQLKTLDLLWMNVPSMFNAAKERDRRQYGNAHGLAGCYCAYVGTKEAGVTTFAHARTKVAAAISDLIAMNLKGVKFDATIGGFSAPGLVPVQYAIWEYNGVNAVRFMVPDDMRFGPRGQDPITHHLLAWGLGIDGVTTIDRHLLNGAW